MKLSKAAKEALLLIGTGLFIALVLCFSIDYARAGDLPDPALTPGANSPDVVRDVTYDDLCPHANTSAVRNVTSKEKKQIFAEYGLQQEHRADCTGPKPKGGLPACYEGDHLCSLELGCNNDIKNLWPQAYETGEKPYTGQWGAHTKDALENQLHAMICAKQISIKDAQSCISTDWIDCYKKVME